MMKRLVSVLLVVFALSVPAFAKEQKVTLKVKGWHCGGCAEGTVAKIKEVKGVKSVETDVSAKIATVVFDDPATLAQVEKAITDSGYQVEK